MTTIPTATIRSPWLTRREAAEYLKVTPRTLTGWASLGQIKPQYTPGGQMRLHQADLDALLETGKWPKKTRKQTRHY